MRKQEFLGLLRKGLSGLPRDDREERIRFYTEMIDDRMEDGLLEEDAVLAVGAVDEIITQAIADIPLAKIAKERMNTQRRLKAWEVVLLVLGSPIWLSLGLSAVAVVLSLYVSAWAVVISLWAVFATLVVCCPGSIGAGVIFVCTGGILSGIAMFGCGLVCAGLSVFMFFGCKAATKGLSMLIKKTVVWIKSCFTKGEGAQ